jgi:hypothetical protein
LKDPSKTHHSGARLTIAGPLCQNWVVRQFEILARMALTIYPISVPAPSVISGTPDKLISSRKVLSTVH